MTASYVKDPQAVLDYQLDWSLWLAAAETITTSTWTVPAGITKTTDSHTTTAATIWLSGGTLGQRYSVVNEVTTNQGRTDDRTIQIVIEDR